MPYSLPAFNLLCHIYDGPWLTKVFRLEAPCNLAWGRRVQAFASEVFEPEVQPASVSMILLTPAGTDVRATVPSGMGDVVEVPAGSGRWYGVVAVDDLGKGFANEHRGAVINQVSQHLDPVLYAGCLWPIPMP